MLFSDSRCPTLKTITKFILIVVFGFFYTSLSAQKLLESRQSSPYTYIFKISDDEAKQIYSKRNVAIESDYFHTLIDSFATGDSYDKKLDPGHYLKAYTDKDIQKTEIATVQNLEVFLLNNYHDLVIQLYDLDGNLISDADVNVKNRSLQYNDEIQAYSLRKSNKRGLLQVTHLGKTSFYYLDRDYNNSAFRRNSRKVLYGIPLKYVWTPIEFVAKLPVDGVLSIAEGWSRGTIRRTENFFVRTYHQVACLFDDYHCYPSRGKNYQGYLVFNKPKYKPGDTVKFKSFLVNKRGKPLDTPVSILLSGNNKNIQLTTLTPYDKGGYEYQFFLHDSLELRLDTQYTIRLKDEKDRIVISRSFRYEDYELAKNQLHIRLPKKNQYKDKPFEVYIKATDENELSLQDARVQILMRLIKSTAYFKDNLFIPDTLGYIEKKLEPSSETKIEISDSLFPPASFQYALEVKLLTTDNELILNSENVTYYYLDESLEAELESDSISITFKKNGLSTNRETQVFGQDNFGNETLVFEGETPIKLKLNPFYSFYISKSGDEELKYSIWDKPSLLQVSGNRTADSIKIEVNNPRNLYFNYNTYLKNRQLSTGYSDNLQVSEPLHSLENYQIAIQYIWGGRVKTENISVPIKDKALTIEVDQPDLVYPGQNSTIELIVTDYEGNPIEGVDITAYSLTKKFGYHPPQLPYLGKRRKDRNIINTFNINDSKLNQVHNRQLDFEYWNKKAGLDSIEYYKFLYPKNDIYQTSFYPKDSITQFAPFIFSDGKPVPIHVVYVDNKPVYFSWSTNERPYSFNVRSGYHQVELRTRNNTFTVNNVYFPENQKLIFSLDESIAIADVDRKKAKNKLSKHEQRFLFRYIFPYRNTFHNKFAFIQYGDNTQLLSKNTGYRHTSLAGPVSGNVTFRILDNIKMVFVHEPYFEYDFQNGMMKMRTYDKSRFPTRLYNRYGYNRHHSLYDLVLTPEKINDLYQRSIITIRTTEDYFQNPRNSPPGFGRLVLEIESEEDSDEALLNIFVFKQDDPNFVRVYPGNTRLLHQLDRGDYKLIFFYLDKKYHIVDNVLIDVNGFNYLRVHKPDVLNKDAFSETLDDIIQDIVSSGKSDEKSRTTGLEQINSTLQNYFNPEGTFRVDGTVQDDTGLPLPGVNVIVKGTSRGAQTDFDGNYSIFIHEGEELVFSYIGFDSQEIIPKGNRVDVQLEPGGALDEVVVTAYSHSRRNSTQAVTSADLDHALAGKVGGIEIRPGAATDIRIRGMNSLSGDSQPLYVINGMIYTGDFIKINADQITSIRILQGLEATNLYGEKGANGVVIIELNDEGLLSTLGLEDKGADFDDTFYGSALSGSSLRQNFSDDAFWQPTLKTDQNGKVSFDVTFPDDITNWETFYLAMNGKKQSGQTNKSIKSYKPLMAQLAVPRFLIAKDTAYALGKSLNYTTSEQEATITYEVNDAVQFSKTERFENAIIDTLMITAKDSVSVKYVLEKPDGYFDGELREIPVYPQGLYQTEGQFYVLEDNKKTDLSFHPDYGTASLYARADVLDVLDEEMDHVIGYRYLCNEQVASKLKMLLMQKKLAAYKEVPFKNERRIKKHISLLLKNQKHSGLWGWWKNSEESYWISLQVLEALAWAKEDGYTVKLNPTKTTQEMIWQLENTSSFNEIYRILRALKRLDVVVDYPYYIEKLEEKEEIEFNDRLMLTELQQVHGMDYQLDSILKNRRTTLFGNVYFSDDKNISNILNNNIQSTLIAYKILKADTLDHTAELSKMRNYFFERRRSGNWRNTFESAQIVEAILDDFIQEGAKSVDPKLIIEGDIAEVVDTFPFEFSVAPNQNISVTRSGNFPIYFTSHQSYWESEPQKRAGNFEINTQFKNGNKLKGGEEATLLVKVNIKKDADYVLINVPIPGGCSYASTQSKNRFESHRENFKNEATIFCDRLPVGEHEFEVKLVPRYSGNYTLNPAKIELMYFPTFNANNVIKSVSIE